MASIKYRRRTPDKHQFASTFMRGPSLMRQWRSSDTAWQVEAWRWYHRIPELHAAIQYKSHAIGRMSLYVGIPDPEGAGDPEPVTDPQIVKPLAELYGGYEQHSEMLRRWAQQLLVSGEAYVVAADLPPQLPDIPLDRAISVEALRSEPQRVWQVISGQDMRQTTGGRWEIDFATPAGVVTRTYTQPDANSPEQTESDVMVLRDWVSDPQHYVDPDSPVRSLMDILSALDGVNGHIKATSESRLAGAGLLALHDELTINPVSTNTDLAEDPEINALIDGMVTPIRNRDIASAVVPLLLRSGGDRSVNDLIQWINNPGTEYDRNLLNIRQALILSIAAGIDVPAEVVTGVKDTNHWNALYEGQDAVRIGLSWIANQICATLTNGYLRPALADAGVIGADRYVVWWDASSLTMDPDRSDVALQLVAQGTARGRAFLSDAAVLRACGFGTDDAPDPGEATITPPNGTGTPEPDTEQPVATPPDVSSTSGFPRTNRVAAPREPAGV